jgi:Zn-finger nucleic acid-binding protein
MTRIENEGLHYCSCSSCFGVWIDEIALKRQLALDRRDQPQSPASPDQPEASLADLAAVVAESDSRQPLRCPACSKPMVKDRYHPMIPVNIDRCRLCHSIWLDAGEFNLLRRLYRELAASDDPKIVALREKIASVDAQWQGRPTATDNAAQALNEIGDVGYVLTSLVEILSR